MIGDDDYAAFIADHDGLRDRRHRMGFRQRLPEYPPASLDLLVIEEAGQFSLANTIAVARAARNLLLLGDPQQLPQVSQGTHPEPVDDSALGWLVDGHHTLPPSAATSWTARYRMHPAVCEPVSRLSYDGRLHSREDRHRRAAPRRVSARGARC